MLGKLIKYEFKATARMFLFAYLALIVIALVRLATDAIGIGSGNSGGTFIAIYILLFVVATIAVVIITLVSVILRFGRNLLGNEGYLMFTLPVSTHSLILSKLIVGIVWFIASVAVLIVGFLIIAPGQDSLIVSGSLIDVLNAGSAMGINVGGWIALFCALVIVSWASTMLLLYGSMSLGQHITKNRVGGSFIAFIILSIIMQIATWAVFGFTGITDRLGNDAEQLATFSTGNNDVLADPAMLKSLIDFTNGSFYSFTFSSTIVAAAIGIACYFLSHYLLKRKLNLA